MGEWTTPNLVPQATRRNRVLLAAAAIAIAPFFVMGTGIFNHHRHPGPLLTAVDDVAMQTSPADSPIRGSLASQSFPDSPPAWYMARVPVNSNDAEIDSSLSSLSAETTYEFDDSMRWFNGRPVRPVRTLKMTVTAYSPDERSCGESADGITASGYSVWTNAMKMAAADTSVLPFGSLLSVPGYDNGEVIPVLDRGGAIKGRRLDLLYPSHEQARFWGTQKLEITVWEYADGKPSDFRARFNSAAAVKN